MAGRGPDESVESGEALARITMFSDGVFAIAITLLVLTLEVPRNIPAQVVKQELLARIMDERPDIFAFAFSFWVIGSLWMAHHRMFRYITRMDNGLLTINMLLLLCVAFLPYPVGIFGDYPAEPAAVIFFAGAQGITALVSTWLWVYASGRGLTRPGMDAAVVRYLTLRGLTVAGLFLASIPVALVSVWAAYATWGLIWLVHVRLKHRFVAPV